MSRLNFCLEATSGKARAGRLTTLHSEVQTPLFMPVGTHATVRHQNIATLKASGSQILLANTYHLHLRPGPEVFEKMGGIHGFTKWTGSFLTDSGGFQIFSLPNARQMNEEGAVFKSYVNGDNVLLSPERSIATQRAIGSDIMMVLDQCIPSTSAYDVAVQAMELTHRWALRSLAARGDSPQSMFAIVQGACFEKLRKQSAEFLREQPFDGFAIGGLAVGESKAEREDFTELTTSFMPANLPRYLMGVGTPIDLLEAVKRGVDMFDCIIPTALASQGVAYTSHGRLRLSRGIYKFADQALDGNCTCPTCSQYSRAYIHHLVKAEEPLAVQLIGSHNLYFYHQLMRDIRQSILADQFEEFYRGRRDQLGLVDQDNPVVGPVATRRRLKRGPEKLGDYEIQRSQEFASIRHVSSGEVMHSVSAPDEEAKLLYIEQSRLAELLAGPSTAERSAQEAEELVLWDVGLGAAHNAMAAIRAAERASENGFVARPLRIVSFENDLDPLKLATRHTNLFPHLRHAAPAELLAQKIWISKSGLIRWELLEGDFLQLLPTATAPDLVYFDPFSAKTNAALWTLDCFKKIRLACAAKATEMFTYSASTAVRAGLLAAGFRVAKGIGTGPKAETTIAVLSTVASARELLNKEWLDRWERSGARHPAGVGVEQFEAFERAIREHPQFN